MPRSFMPVAWTQTTAPTLWRAAVTWRRAAGAPVRPCRPSRRPGASAVRRGHLNIAAKADDVAEAELSRNSNSLTSPKPDRPGSSPPHFGKKRFRRQGRGLEVLRWSSIILSTVSHRSARAAVAGDEVQRERGLVVGVEIGPVHRHDDRLALATSRAPRRTPHDDAALSADDRLFDAAVTRPRAAQRMPDDGNGQGRPRHNADHPVGQRNNPFGVQAPANARSTK